MSNPAVEFPPVDELSRWRIQCSCARYRGFYCYRETTGLSTLIGSTTTSPTAPESLLAYLLTHPKLQNHYGSLFGFDTETCRGTVLKCIPGAVSPIIFWASPFNRIGELSCGDFHGLRYNDIAAHLGRMTRI